MGMYFDGLRFLCFASLLFGQFCLLMILLCSQRNLLASIIWMSALTNCLITGFTSDQLMHYFPSFYTRTEGGYTEMGHDKGFIAVFMIFGLEHVVLVLGLLTFAIVPAVPEDVQDELERRQYLRMKEHDEAIAKLKEKKKT